MRIISRKALREFWERHPESEQFLQAWHKEVQQADWATPAHITERFPNASILANNRVVFRIRGNAFRVVVEIFYQGRMVYIRFVGTHAEYNRIDAEKV